MTSPFIQTTKFGNFLICNPEETIQNELMQNGQFEILGPLLAVNFQEFLGGSILDIGANIGTFSIVAARALQGKKVIAIEPQRMVFMELCANILLNELQNVLPLNIAIGTANKFSKIKVPFFNVFTERFTGSVSLDAHTQKTRGSIQGVAEPSIWAKEYDLINLYSLDDILEDKQIEQVYFIKIDVEGMELEVLRSAEKIISSQHPFLFFESWSLPEFTSSVKELNSYILEMGYLVINFGNDTFAFHPDIISQSDVEAKLSSMGIL